MRVLKAIGKVILLLLLLVGCYAGYVHVSGIPKYPVPKSELKVQLTPERIARGKHIASLLCAECHRDPTTQKLTGRQLFDLPREFGAAYSKNITHFGLERWTDGELAVLLRTGIRRDGQYVPPWMVKLPRVSDEDLQSIIAFLRSDDPMVAADMTPSRESEPSFLAKLLTHVAFKPTDWPDRVIPPPNTSDKIAYGRYLADDLYGCYACHSADFKKMDDHVPSHSAGYYGGGNEMPDINGRIVSTPNLTPDPEFGLGKWTLPQFKRAVREGFRPDNTPLRLPMPLYLELGDDELEAIWAFLQTVPRLQVPRKPSQVPELVGQVTEGGKIYYKYKCYACHGTDGLGYCDLRQAYKKYPQNDQLIGWIRDPQKIAPGSKMPTWEGVIADAEFTPLAEYVRLLGERSLAGGARTANP